MEPSTKWWAVPWKPQRWNNQFNLSHPPPSEPTLKNGIIWLTFSPHPDKAQSIQTEPGR